MFPNIRKTARYSVFKDRAMISWGLSRAPEMDRTPQRHACEVQQVPGKT
jgi:hypothetical protein